ncbi:FadR family transcriptional regulator [bacterium]|nr:FadR family transcriptional regulator [bacterium]
MLKPFKHKKISDQIFEQIRDMIYRGEYSPGQRLMSERDLATLFGVGRPTVREAIQKLIDQGLIESKRGVGAFVLDEKTRYQKTTPLLQILPKEEFSIAEFLEIRMALEAKGAEMAAKRATDEDVLMIEKSLERMRWGSQQESKGMSMSDDIAFHMNIAYASRNMFQIHLMKHIYDVQYYAMEKAYSDLLMSLRIDKLIFQQHENIVQSIKNREPDQARRFMEEHISTVLKNIVQV